MSIRGEAHEGENLAPEEVERRARETARRMLTTPKAGVYTTRIHAGKVEAKRGVDQPPIKRKEPKVRKP